MSARSVRCGEEGSSPIVRDEGEKGTVIGSNGSCGPGTSDGDREDEVVIIVRTVKSNKDRPGALLEGVGGKIGPLESAGVVHDGVEGLEGSQREVAIETGEA